MGAAVATMAGNLLHCRPTAPGYCGSRSGLRGRKLAKVALVSVGISSLRADGPRATVTVVTSKDLARTGRTIHFFASRSFSAALLSMASAKSFFSLTFSLSSPLRRSKFVLTSILAGFNSHVEFIITNTQGRTWHPSYQILTFRFDLTFTRDCSPGIDGASSLTGRTDARTLYNS
jgi:hypothetical protein